MTSSAEEALDAGRAARGLRGPPLRNLRRWPCPVDDPRAHRSRFPRRARARGRPDAPPVQPHGKLEDVARVYATASDALAAKSLAELQSAAVVDVKSPQNACELAAAEPDAAALASEAAGALLGLAIARCRCWTRATDASATRLSARGRPRGRVTTAPRSSSACMTHRAPSSTCCASSPTTASTSVASSRAPRRGTAGRPVLPRGRRARDGPPDCLRLRRREAPDEVLQGPRLVSGAGMTGFPLFWTG